MGILSRRKQLSRRSMYIQVWACIRSLKRHIIRSNTRKSALGDIRSQKIPFSRFCTQLWATSGISPQKRQPSRPSKQTQALEDTHSGSTPFCHSSKQAEVHIQTLTRRTRYSSTQSSFAVRNHALAKQFLRSRTRTRDTHR